MSDSLRDTGHDLSFDELARLRQDLQHVLDTARASLGVFYFPPTGGFAHKVTPGKAPIKWSKSSTATCLSFLKAAGDLSPEPWVEKSALVKAIADDSEWKSAGLDKDNPFTVSFLLEALDALGGRRALDKEQSKTVRKKLTLLKKSILEPDEPGGVRLQNYAATAFLTYKAVASLDKWGRLKGEVAEAVNKWVWAHLNKESLLVSFSSPDADVFEVAYSVLVASRVTRLDSMAPQQRFLLRQAIDQFFCAQRKGDGGWPRSRPLFVYPSYGHAYCFDYELLAAMLEDRQLRPYVYERLGELRLAAEGLIERKYPFEAPEGDGEDVAYGWASGHHGADPRPESWSTASALHFCLALHELVAEAIRIATFKDVGAEYSSPKASAAERADLPESFLDSRIQLDDGSARSLKRMMKDRFIKPLLADRERLDYGKPLQKTTPSSAILYGPPGTSKTKLADLIAEKLGWPLLRLDPSHLTRQGLDRVHAEANRLFLMLQECERIVVLLDEFDELMRDREDGELETRFLTTAMLPKLTKLSDERRLVYLVATNHLERFDAAIRRPGRFDRVIPVMPPTIEAKRSTWEALDEALKRVEDLGEEEAKEATAALSDLTFAEADELRQEVEGIAGNQKVSGVSAEKLGTAFIAAGGRCTLRQQVASTGDGGGGDGTWKAEISSLKSRIRLGVR
jgi:ATPase family associated with various cellular activities (AAA)